MTPRGGLEHPQGPPLRQGAGRGALPSLALGIGAMGPKGVPDPRRLYDLSSACAAPTGTALAPLGGGPTRGMGRGTLPSSGGRLEPTLAAPTDVSHCLAEAERELEDA